MAALMASWWFRVQFPAPGYVAAFRVDDELVIVEAPPIMRRWIGRPVFAFADWSRNYGATFQRI